MQFKPGSVPTQVHHHDVTNIRRTRLDSRHRCLFDHTEAVSAALDIGDPAIGTAPLLHCALRALLWLLLSTAAKRYARVPGSRC